MTKRKNFVLVVICIAVGLFAGQFISHTVLFSSHVVGDSMNPTYFDGDKIYVYRLETPNRGDVMVVDEGDKYVIKRCIGIPGDTIQVYDGFVYVNDEKIQEDYLKVGEITADAGIANSPVELNEGEYFMMGDNRSISYDSRHVGKIKEEQILGVVLN